MVGTKEKCLKSGMNNYISKPIDSDVFKDTLGLWFTFPDKQPKKKRSSENTNSAEIINFAALEHCVDTPEEKQIFCNIFFKITNETLNTLKQECTDGENTIWVEEMHKIKGSAGTIGATHLSALCAEAQEMETTTKEERLRKLKNINAVYKETKKLFKEIWA